MEKGATLAKILKQNNKLRSNRKTDHYGGDLSYSAFKEVSSVDKLPKLERTRSGSINRYKEMAEMAAKQQQLHR